MEQYEINNLKVTLETIKNLLEIEKNRQVSIRRMYRDDPLNLDRSLKASANRIKKLSSSIEKPYFGRIIFTGNQKKSDLYIGKNSIIDEENRIVVADWRAPISTLYYDSNIGPTSYVAPDGVIEGILELKRQYNIENSELLSYYDVDIISNDQLLQNYLNTNNDKRLKNIVSTIQSEQNAIIRKPINKDLIIQGVAGSGKTTVALHRIAYLEYNYRNSIKANQYLVIGPNTVFMDYIKSVLPDLDVDDVNQNTLEELTRKITEEDIHFKPINAKLNSKVNGKDTSTIDKFKGSLEYKNMIDKYFDDLMNNVLNDKPLDIDEFRIIPNEIIKENFDVAIKSFPSVSDAVKKTILYLTNYVETNSFEYKQAFNEVKYRLLDENIGNEEERKKIRKRFEKIEKSLQQKFKPELTRFFAPLTKDVTKLYADFIKSINKYNSNNYEEFDLLKKTTLESCKNNQFDFEDIAALLYIASKVKNMKPYKQIMHIVVDEAQDLSMFNYYSLKQIFSNSTFSIYGDLAQSIYDYRSISDWDEVKAIFNDAELIELNKSYRTTDEIMKAADLITTHIGINPSEDVIRHGANVELHDYDMMSAPNHIKAKIEEYRNKGYKSIAIISKNDLLTNYINDDLAFIEINAQNITSKTEDYSINNDVITISNAIAKGLEFDAVIINNASEQVYNSENNLDMKLLYVAMTRALHEVDIVYDKELTKPLKSLLNNDTKVKQKLK